MFFLGGTLILGDVTFKGEAGTPKDNMFFRPTFKCIHLYSKQSVYTLDNKNLLQNLFPDYSEMVHPTFSILYFGLFLFCACRPIKKSYHECSEAIVVVSNDRSMYV